LLLSPKISLPLLRSLLCFSTLVSLPLSLISSLYVLFFFFVSSLSSFSLFLPLFLLSISLVHPKSSLQPPLPRF
jgi:hypothetical protein